MAAAGNPLVRHPFGGRAGGCMARPPSERTNADKLAAIKAAQRSSGGFSRLRDAVLAGDARAVAEAARALPARAWMAGGDGAALLHEAGAMPGARSTPTTPTTPSSAMHAHPPFYRRCGGDSCGGLQRGAGTPRRWAHWSRPAPTRTASMAAAQACFRRQRGAGISRR